MNEIITEKENRFLLNWIIENEHQAIPNERGLGRRMINLWKAENVPKLFFEVKERILKFEGITNYCLDPIFGDMATINDESAFIHDHSDPVLPDSNHIRSRLILSKPEEGGIPIYTGL